jgi:hypothetical protein
MRTLSLKGNSAEEISEQLETEMANGFKPTLSIVFIASDAQLSPVQRMLTEMHVQIFGSSAGAPFTDGDFGYDSIIVLLMDLDPSAFKIELMPGQPKEYVSLAQKIGNAGVQAFAQPSYLVLAGGLLMNSEDVIEGIERVAHTEKINMFGGFASDDFKMVRVFVFSNNAAADEGILALILDETKIHLTGLAIGGWQPVGNEKTITKSKDVTVYTIDNEPALDFISRYSGISKEKFQNDSPAAISLSSNFQFLWIRPDKYPVMRPPLYINKEDGSIRMGAALPEGSKVKLCLMPGTDVIEAAVGQFSRLREQEPRADAIIMFSCAARQLSLGPSVGDEIDRIKKIWDAPMVGFFSYSEIGRALSGNNEAHSMSCSLALLKEVKQ